MNDAREPEEPEEPDEPAEPTYFYKPSLMGGVFAFRLSPTALVWETGAHSGSVPYAQMRRLRLSFRPVTMQHYRFLTEIWPAAGPKLVIVSTSWRSIMEQERKDRDYRAFVSELHGRLAAAGGHPLLQTGSPSFLYWPGVVVFVAITLVLVALLFRGLQGGAFAATGIVGAFFALFLWQVGSFFLRNRPGTYTPDALPQQVLPRA